MTVTSSQNNGHEKFFNAGPCDPAVDLNNIVLKTCNTATERKCFIQFEISGEVAQFCLKYEVSKIVFTEN